MTNPYTSGYVIISETTVPTLGIELTPPAISKYSNVTSAAIVQLPDSVVREAARNSELSFNIVLDFKG